MTYQEAYDKIIEAYFKDEISPYQPQFCFCGTLCVADNYGTKNWDSPIHCDYSQQPYTKEEYVEMEKALLVGLGNQFVKDFTWESTGIGKTHPDYEERLFTAMSAALDVLREIHIGRGEIIDNISKPFTKRQLVN